jgi:hypothetical protein
MLGAPEQSSYHAILSTLDTFINNLPPCALQSAQEITIRWAFADNLMKRQMAMREYGFLTPSTLAGCDNIHLVNKWRGGIAISAPALR